MFYIFILQHNLKKKKKKGEGKGGREEGKKHAKKGYQHLSVTVEMLQSNHL